MDETRSITLDAVVIGGGIAGVWILDELVRRGVGAVLVESSALGRGQTVWSQGIIHGGLKYTLSGLMNPAAESIREMPGVWRACLAGEREPDLSGAGVRAPHCHLWRTESLTSRLGMIGARAGLRIAPVALSAEERPAVLRGCPGVVARLDEQVIDPVAVMRVFAERHAERMVLSTVERTSVGVDADGCVVRCAGGLELRARRVVFAAGSGNAGLRRMVGLDTGAMQTRPLRMVMVRSAPDRLAELNGHCVDGNRTRVTVTSAIDRRGRRVWQVGGEVAEVGTGLSGGEAVALARRELVAALPGLGFSGCEWSWYDAPRAEHRTPGGKRPEDIAVLKEGRVITAWPTKLALAPRLAERVADEIGRGEVGPGAALPGDTAHPGVAAPAWDEERAWIADESLG